MGQAPSKESGSRFFQAKEQIEVSPQLEQALEKNNHTDFLRQQVTDKYIEDRVAERLRQLEFETHSTVKYAESRVPPLDEGRISEDDSPHLQERIKELEAELERRPKIGNLDSKSEAARQVLTSCLLENPKKPLLCREEFEAFQQLVRKSEDGLKY